MFVVDCARRRSRSVLINALAIVAVVFAIPVGSGLAAGQKPKTSPELPALHKVRIVRELQEQRERQLRAGLEKEAAETAKQLEEMARTQTETCSHWWSIRDIYEAGGRLTKAQKKVLTDKKTAPQMAQECYWRPGAPSPLLSDGDDPDRRQADQVIGALQLANELNGRLTRALLFVEPTLTAAGDKDLLGPIAGFMVAMTTSPSEFRQMMLDLARLSLPGADQAEAVVVFERMLSLAEPTGGLNPALVLLVTGMRAQFAELQGDIAAALNHAREAVAYVERRFGADSIQLCPPLWQEASLLMSSGQPDRAIAAADRCRGLAASRGPSSLTYATALNNLGVLYHRNGATDRALDAYRQSLASYERNAVALQDTSMSSQDPLLHVHANLGLAYWRSGAAAQAYRHLQLARQRMLREGTAHITERGVVESMAKLSAELDVFLTVERAAPNSPNEETLALPMLLERKGFALGTKAATMQALAGLPDQQREYRRLLAYRSMLARATPATPDERQKQRQAARDVDLQIQTLEINARQDTSIEGPAPAAPDARGEEYSRALVNAMRKVKRGKDDRRNDLEAMMDQQRRAAAEIAPRFKDYLESQQRAARGHRENLVQHIQAALPDTSALVEMVRFRPFNAAAAAGADRWSLARYGAYVVRPSGTPSFVDCGDAAPIDEMIVEFRRALSQPRGTLAHDLGRRLDAALMQPLRASLGPATRIYLSPDGALNLVPFGALVDERDRHLIETLTFTYLSSGRDLIREAAPTTPASSSAVVIADPSFDAGAPAPADTGGSVPAQLRSVLGNHFEPLPGTAAEAQAIKAVLTDAAVLWGDQATETALKSVSSPRVLHVATHGFFLQDQDLAAAAEPGSATTVEDPMLRSGLVFAGANAGRSGSDDGVLTALEAAALALAGTELVVLSACETGVGDVKTGEGVFGLRRAFMVAGAETLVMSLWQVDDDATRQLMVEFYGRLAKGEGRAEALRQASLALLSDPARRHPFFWASFISAGEAGQMRR